MWRSPPADLRLEDDDVHVWRASIDLPAQQVRELRCILTPDELERAERFHFPRDRNRFIVARGVLRDILAHCVNEDPGQIRFHYGPYGKPNLVRRDGERRLCFNLAHSRGVALYALTYHREIGVDLEYKITGLIDERIAEHFFSAQEIAALRALPPNAQIEAFFNCWTRKEAYIKAKGKGLSLPLDQFVVSLAPGEPAMLKDTPGDPLEANRWSLHTLSPGPGYVAALAVEGHSLQIKYWRWDMHL
jgi:4'-phosphopantetheinyl transferase